MPLQQYGEYVSSGWVNISPASGWTMAAGSPPLSYCLTGTTVQLRGTLNPPGVLAGNLTICTIPQFAPDGVTSIRPPFAYRFACPALSAVAVAIGAQVVVNTDGTIVLEGVSALASISLNSVRFTLST